MDETLENLPPRPEYCPDKDGGDVGLIVWYQSSQAENLELGIVELGYKALTLFTLLVYPGSPSFKSWL